MKIKRFNQINEATENKENLFLVITGLNDRNSERYYTAFNTEDDAKIYILNCVNEDIEQKETVDLDSVLDNYKNDIIITKDGFPNFKYYNDAIKWVEEFDNWFYEIEEINLLGKQEIYGEEIIIARKADKYNL